MSSISGKSAGSLPERLSAFQSQFDAWMKSWLEGFRERSLELDEGLSDILDLLLEFSGRSGKRLRPYLTLLAYQACGGKDPEEVMPVAAAAEMLHVFALAHDDVMDASDLRRGLPTLHRLAEQFHREKSLRGSAERFGESVGILAGDLGLVISDEMIDTSTIPPQRHGELRRVWNAMRQEVILGQYLDIAAASLPEPAPEERIWSIISLKSGKYSVERPLHLGVAAAAADTSLYDVFTGYGIPLGRAFQITDDILGLFGDEAVTGKPIDSDIREGKSTLLISRAYHSLSTQDREFLKGIWGNPDASTEEVLKLRELIRQCGALDHCRQQSQHLQARALCAIQSSALSTVAKESFTALADFIINRPA